jgi:hypothetical protein
MAVGDRNTGSHVNKDFMNDQSISAKHDKLVRGQPTVLAQFMRFYDAA